MLRALACCAMVLTACARCSDRALPVSPTPAPVARAGPVTHYDTELVQVGALVGLRRFEQGGQPWYLPVDPATLKTRVVADDGRAIATDWAAVRATPYGRALFASEQHDTALEDSGITHLLPSASGVVLTVDLCPSRKHFDFHIIDALLRDVAPAERPVPVAFSVSGVWLREHPDDLARLAAMDGKDLAITWVNHSMHHRYDPKVPVADTFLLTPGTDVRAEVLDAEVVMLEAGLTPSIYFRFPGLVSDRAVVERVVALGQVVVGSDAWLAKGEAARRGSIVLIHGNGNEPVGVADLVKLLERSRTSIERRSFLLLDLSDSLAAE